MPYPSHWKRYERWILDAVNLTTYPLIGLAVNDELRFEGNAMGAATDILIRIHAGTESTWATHCLHIPGSPEKMKLKHNALGDFTITHIPASPGIPPTPDTPAYLDCDKDPPTGTAWTAKEQLPPIP